jgi:hypothetical protein
MGPNRTFINSLTVSALSDFRTDNELTLWRKVNLGLRQGLQLLFLLFRKKKNV